MRAFLGWWRRALHGRSCALPCVWRASMTMDLWPWRKCLVAVALQTALTFRGWGLRGMDSKNCVFPHRALFCPSHNTAFGHKLAFSGRPRHKPLSSPLYQPQVLAIKINNSSVANTVSQAVLLDILLSDVSEVKCCGNLSQAIIQFVFLVCSANRLWIFSNHITAFPWPNGQPNDAQIHSC